MKFEKVKKFVKEHKKEILIGAATVVGGVVIYKIIKTEPKIEQLIETSTDICNSDVKIPNFSIGQVDDYWVDQWGHALILNDVTVEQLGDVGKEILKLPGVTNKTEVSGQYFVLSKVTETK